MSQALSDVSMGDGIGALTDSQLDREASAVLEQGNGNDERLDDALATTAVCAASSRIALHPAFAPALIVFSVCQQAVDDAVQVVDGADDTGNGGSGDDDEEQPTDVDGLMAAGDALLSRFALGSQGESQMTNDDGGDYEEEKIREEFKKYKHSTWMHKRVDTETKKMNLQLKKYDKTKRDFIAPVTGLIQVKPEKKTALTLLTGLLSDASAEGDLRDAILEAAEVLKSQVKLIEEITETHTLVKWGNICLEEKKAEEAAASAAGSSTMTAVEALIAGNTSKKQRKK